MFSSVYRNIYKFTENGHEWKAFVCFFKSLVNAPINIDSIFPPRTLHKLIVTFRMPITVSYLTAFGFLNSTENFIWKRVWKKKLNSRFSRKMWEICFVLFTRISFKDTPGWITIRMETAFLTSSVLFNSHVKLASTFESNEHSIFSDVKLYWDCPIDEMIYIQFSNFP